MPPARWASRSAAKSARPTRACWLTYLYMHMHMHICTCMYMHECAAYACLLAHVPSLAVFSPIDLLGLDLQAEPTSRSS